MQADHRSSRPAHRPPSARWPSWWAGVQGPVLENGVCTCWPRASQTHFPRPPSPRSLSRVNISMFGMKRTYPAFKVVIFPFRDEEECAVPNLDSRSPGRGRLCVPDFTAKVPVCAHEAWSEVPDMAAAFGSDGTWL